jgi:cytochrome P450
MRQLSALLPRRRAPERVVFAFAGGTGARPGMATDLYADEAAFRDTVRECCPIVAERSGYDPLPAFEAGVPAPSKRDEIVLLGLVQLGQLALWREAGVEPDAVLGVSLGEMVAAHAAGGLSLEDTVAVLTSVLDAVVEVEPQECRLFAVEASAAEAAALAESAPVELELLGTTSPRIAMLLSTAEDEHPAREHIASARTILKETVSRHPHHTRRRTSVLPKLERELAGIRPRPVERPCFLASCGRDVQSDAWFDARFWAWMVESPYDFGAAGAAALAGGPVVVQIGAHPSLTPAVRETARTIGARVEMVATTRSDEPETVTWSQARARLLRRRPAPGGGNGAGRAATFDPEDPEMVRDPWPVLSALRERGPVHRLADGSWLVVDTALIDDALARPNEFSNRMWRESVDFALLGADPPEHGPVRRRVAAVLGPAGVDPLAAHASAVAREVVEPLTARASFDALRDLAEPVVHRTVARLLDVDADELGRAPSPDPTAPGDPTLARSQRAFRGLAERPGLVGRLELDDAPRDSVVKLLWFAGTLTTVRHLGWAVLELDRRPSLRAEVADGAADAFLDEILRLHPPELFLRRIAATDARLGDALIPAGSNVALAIGAANRDPQRFDEPDRLRLDRPAAGNHTFGRGPHRCPGARLNRHMSRAALDALLEAMPDFRVVQPDAALQYVAGTAHGLRGLAVAPVR